METLEIELTRGLEPHSAELSISTTMSFGDLLWDADMGLETIFALEHAAIVDARSGVRRIVLQRIVGELRYWLTTDRDPAAVASEMELGVVESTGDAIALCEEFLCRAPMVLTTRRRVFGA